MCGGPHALKDCNVEKASKSLADDRKFRQEVKELLDLVSSMPGFDAFVTNMSDRVRLLWYGMRQKLGESNTNKRLRDDKDE